METNPKTLPIELRREGIPIIRYGNFAGPGYAGRFGPESIIHDPHINGGKPIQAAELTQTPQGLMQFMQLALKTEPNGYLDQVTRNHDVLYTVAEIRFMHHVQTQFEGRLPHQLSAEDQNSTAYQGLVKERNLAFWEADKHMVQAVAAYQPTDFADATYRAMMIKGFYVKAGSGIGGDYKLSKEEVDAVFDVAKAKDPKLQMPKSLLDKLGALGEATVLARSGFEDLVTLPISAQERQFFNEHLKVGDYLNMNAHDGDGNFIPYAQRDYTNRIVLPHMVSEDVFVAQVKMGNHEITMTLDKTNKDNPVFTKETRVKGELVESEMRTGMPLSKADLKNGVRDFEVQITGRTGEQHKAYTLEKPEVPKLRETTDLKTKLEAIKSGHLDEILSTPVPKVNARTELDQQINTYEAGKQAGRTQSDIHLQRFSQDLTKGSEPHFEPNSSSKTIALHR